MPNNSIRLLAAVSASAILATMASCSSGSSSARRELPVTDIQEVPFTATVITDGFWAPRIEVNRTVTIPAALYQCDINGRFDNFAIAGGLMKGEHRGDFSFDDTDPYKVIEGASYSLAAHYDPELDARLDKYIEIIAAAQEEDGYLTTCVTNKCERLSGWWGSSKWEKINSHELYNSGHLYEAAVAHYKATGKRNLLDVALKNADLVCETFGDEEGKIHRPGGHPIIEMALVKLYKLTGDEKYLRQAKYFVDETGRCTDGHAPSIYSQDHMPILRQEEIVGHAVRAGYLYSGVADVASLTHDDELLVALNRIWNNMAGRKLYITGGMGSRAQGEGFGPDFELHNHTDYCETCASISNVYWNHRMFLYTGDSKYIDVLELALYNGVLSGVSLDGDKFFYDNPLESSGEHARQEWFGCACCPGNVTRFIASVPNYMYAVEGDDVFVNLFIQSESEIERGGGRLRLSQTTSYPWSGDVRISVNPEREGRFRMYIRIPGWVKDAPVDTGLYSFVDKAGKYSVKVNGSKVGGRLSDGYVVIDRNWSAGDEIEIALPMEVRQVRAREEVVDDRGKLALMRGPVVYCLEGADQTNGQVFDKFIPEGARISSEYVADKLGGIVELSCGDIRAIPYSTWCNRGSDEMTVWIPSDISGTFAKPEPTIASEAYAYSTSIAAIQDDAPESAVDKEEAWGLNDQWEPSGSGDLRKPYWYWWRKFGTKVDVAYEFRKAETVSSVAVYWLVFDHYDGNYRVPQSWTLYYKDGDGRWKEVSALGEYGTEEDKYNVLRFEPVTTTGLCIVATLQDGVSGGIHEWKVN